MPPKAPPAPVVEVISVSDITAQILANVSVLFNREKDFQVVSAQSGSGLSFYTSVVASDQKSASVHKEYKVILTSPPELSRRGSMMKLLEETERRVAREVLRK